MRRTDSKVITVGIGFRTQYSLLWLIRKLARRYSRDADWGYISRCADAAPGLPLVGNGDVYNWEQYAARVGDAGVATAMIARSALIKPWIFTEIKVCC